MARHAAIRELLQAKFAIDEADWKVPAAYAKKSKRKRGGGSSSPGLLRRLGIR